MRKNSAFISDRRNIKCIVKCPSGCILLEMGKFHLKKVAWLVIEGEGEGEGGKNKALAGMG